MGPVERRRIRRQGSVREPRRRHQERAGRHQRQADERGRALEPSGQHTPRRPPRQRLGLVRRTARRRLSAAVRRRRPPSPVRRVVVPRAVPPSSLELIPGAEYGGSVDRPMREFPGDQITDFYIARRYIIEVDDPTYLTPGGPPVGGPAAPCVIEVGLHATPQGGTFDVLGDSGDWQYCGYLFVDSLGVIHQRPPPDNILWREPIEWKAGVKTYLTFAGQVDNFEAEPLSPSIGPFQFGITFVIGSPESVDVGNLTNPSDT